MGEVSSFLEAWHYGLIAVALLVPVAITSGVLIYCCREHLNQNRAMKGKKKEKSRDRLIVFTGYKINIFTFFIFIL